MGLFDIFKKKPEQPQTHEAVVTTSIMEKSIPNISNTESTKKLDLRKETLKISLEKKSMQNVVARVCVALDKSGSMDSLYRDGTVQSVVERLLPIGLKFDVDKELDIWIFNNNYKRAKSVTESTFHNYVDREITNKYGWGGTSYAPVIHDIIKKYVAEETSKVPTFVIFITDGENDDERDSEQAIVEASHYNIFWQFIGIGHENFRFLKRLDTMNGRLIDNANFFEIKDINHTTDSQLYDMLLNEYPSWEKLARQHKLI